MASKIRFHRTVTQSNPPPVLEPGEPAVILDQVGKADFYIGDSSGNPVLINPAPTPIGGISFDYRWDNDTSISDPNDGNIKMNGDQDPTGGSPATVISVSYITRQGNDFTTLWQNLQVGDIIGIFEGNSGAQGEILYWEVDGVTDNGTWAQIDGSVVFYGGNDIDNNRRTTVFFIADPSARYILQNPSVGTSQDIAVLDAADVPLTLDGAAGQTADLMRFRDDGGTVLSSIDSDGDPEGMTIDAGTFP